MSHSTLLGACAIALAAAAGCYTGGHVDMSDSSTSKPGTTTTVNGTDPASGETSVTGVPCEVADVLARACASCHGEPLSGGAPNRIASYEDLVAPSLTDPSVSVAKLSVARMHDTKQPMPPEGASAADAAVLEAWVAAGMPKGTCDTAVTVGPAGGDPTYATASVCTSNRMWTRGDHGSSSMHPGVACIDCHASSDEGPSYSIAGTVYPSAHEPDDCNGSASGSATVVITDATGKTFSLPLNSAGNFYLRTRITMPYRAKVVSGSKVRAMSAAQTDGDCNGCHQEKADSVTKTPGRVMAP